MAKQFFTNKDSNTLMNKIKGLLEHNSNIKWFDSIVGFICVSGYFTLCLFWNNANIDILLAGFGVHER